MLYNCSIRLFINTEILYRQQHLRYFFKENEIFKSGNAERRRFDCVGFLLSKYTFTCTNEQSVPKVDLVKRFCCLKKKLAARVDLLSSVKCQL